jgi:hypothetical protein
MPTAEQHRQQAEHNKAFVQSFDLDTSPYRRSANYDRLIRLPATKAKP